MTTNTIRRKTAYMLRLLLDGMYSLQDIADRTGMDYETVRPFVNELKAAGVVHIAGWRKRVKQAKPSALYALGIGVDAPRPQAMTGTQRSQRYRQRQQDRPLSKPPKVTSGRASIFSAATEVRLP